MTPTVTSQHTNATTSHTDTTATMSNESLHLLSSQHRLQTCYFKRRPVAPKYLSHRSPLLSPVHQLPAQLVLPTCGTTVPLPLDQQSTQTYFLSCSLQLATKAPQSTTTYTSGHVPLFWPSSGSLNQLELHTQELAILGTTHPLPPLLACLRTGILVE